MNYKDHAMREFEIAGWFKDGKWVDEMQEAVCKHVLKLLEVFAEEGHSGSSAPYTIQLFSQLAKFEIIAPLQGTDDEWTEVSDGVFQNKRASNVFKQKDRFDGQAYDISGKIFYDMVTPEPEHVAELGAEPYKCFYTCSESHVPVTFPYVPKSEYVARPVETTN